MTILRAILDRLKPPTSGVKAERIAAAFLRRHGYRILARNLRNRTGEIDIVAEAPDGRTVVIVEVKAAVLDSSAIHPIRPEGHVNRHKQRKLSSLASQIVRRHRLGDRPVRFDVVGVDLVDGREPAIRHHVSAFESTI